MEFRTTRGWMFALQVASVAMIWVFVLSISLWIIHLARLSRELNDTPSASLAISILAIPVFMIGASVLTYVFVGLQRRGPDPEGTLESELGEASS